MVICTLNIKDFVPFQMSFFFICLNEWKCIFASGFWFRKITFHTGKWGNQFANYVDHYGKHEKKINKSTKNVRDVVKNTKQCYKQHTNVAWSLYSLLLFISECMKLGGLTLEGSHALPYSQAPLCSRISEVVRNLPLSHRWLSNALLIMRYCAETSLFIAADKILLSGWIICNTPSCLMTPECKLRTAWTRAEDFPK